MADRALFTLSIGRTRALSLIHMEGSHVVDLILDLPEGNVPLTADEALRMAEALIRWARSELPPSP